MSMRFESDDAAKAGAPTGVDVPDWLGDDGLVECGSEEEKSVM